MARYSASIVSQNSQLAGAPSGTTVNGYMGYLGAASGCGFRLRRATAGLLSTTAAVPFSQQLAIAFYRQTVAPAGTGIAASVPGQALESWVPADPTAGLFAITATTIGTTGPTIATNPFKVIPFNSQNTIDYGWEGYEEVQVGTGTANGIAFVLLGNTLPSSPVMFARLDLEWEV